MGFRAESERNNREILEEITRGGNGIFIDTCALGKFERDMFGATQMSLSEDAIKKYLYHKMPESKLSTEYVLRNLDKSTAISSYAHGLGGVDEKRVEKDVFEERLKRFVNYGLKALECYYSLYNKTEQRYLEESSNKYSLLRSGGSDYHGSVKTVKIGELSSDGTVPDTKNFTILKAIKNIYKI